MPRRYWLMKTEPDVFSLDDLKACRKQTEPWNGIRNYQARNYMRDDMRVGDGVLFYHSRTDAPGVVGICRIASGPRPDPVAWDPESEYYDPKASPENPRWCLVDVQFVAECPTPVTLKAIKEDPALADMLVAKRGQRLSIQPVTAAEWKRVLSLAGLKAADLTL